MGRPKTPSSILFLLILSDFFKHRAARTFFLFNVKQYAVPLRLYLSFLITY